MKRKPTGELEFFKKIWQEKTKWFCQNCNKPLSKDLSVSYMSHIIPKSKEPKLRLDRNNIKVICAPCHSTWEFGTLDKIRNFNLTPEQKKYLKENNYLRYFKIFGDD